MHAAIDWYYLVLHYLLRNYWYLFTYLSADYYLFNYYASTFIASTLAFADIWYCIQHIYYYYCTFIWHLRIAAIKSGNCIALLRLHIIAFIANYSIHIDDYIIPAAFWLQHYCRHCRFIADYCRCAHYTAVAAAAVCTPYCILQRYYSDCLQHCHIALPPSLLPLRWHAAAAYADCWHLSRIIHYWLFITLTYAAALLTLPYCSRYYLQLTPYLLIWHFIIAAADYAVVQFDIIAAGCYCRLHINSALLRWQHIAPLHWCSCRALLLRPYSLVNRWFARFAHCTLFYWYIIIINQLQHLICWYCWPAFARQYAEFCRCISLRPFRIYSHHIITKSVRSKHMHRYIIAHYIMPLRIDIAHYIEHYCSTLSLTLLIAAYYCISKH